MLQEAATLGALVLDSVKSVRLTRNNRTIIAKSVGNIYRELGTLVENGDEILRMLRRYNDGKNINLDSLGHLLQEQHVIIDRINKTLKNRKVKTALSIHAPQLSPLQVLLYGKSLRIALLRDEVDAFSNRGESIPPVFLERRPRRMIRFPSNRSIDKSGRELNKIRAQVKQLRTFIVSNFQVHEVV